MQILGPLVVTIPLLLLHVNGLGIIFGVVGVELPGVLCIQLFAVTEVSTLEELKSAVAAGGEIKLVADIINITENIEIINTVALDLNGHTIRVMYLCMD